MKSSSNSHSHWQSLRSQLAWVVVINLLVVLLTVQFYFTPQGTSIRPMGWVACVFVLGIVGLVFVPFIIPKLWFLHRSVWPWLTVALALIPVPLAMLMYRNACYLKGLIQSD